MCGFDGVQKRNYFRGEPIRRTEVEVRVGKLKNGETAGKDEGTREMIKGYVILSFRVGLRLKTGGLLSIFHCTKVH